MAAEKKRLLIIAKTYPELSSKYIETVCTAAVDEDGHPYRLYPIPFRYLAGDQKFDRYQWIEAPIEKSEADSRPESFRIITENIVLGDKVRSTTDEWGVRRDIVLREEGWQFSSMTAIRQAQERSGLSLAFLYPTKIKSVQVKSRDPNDAQSFQEKFLHLKATRQAERDQLTLFERSTPPEMKKLEYVGQRVCVEWLCSDPECSSHNMQILDWETL